MRAAGLALAVALIVGSAGAARALPVAGTVRDRRGTPVEYATVAVPALKLGAVTDEQGRFTLELPPGPVEIEVQQIGYERARVSVRVEEGLAPLAITLGDEPVPLAEVTVAASSFGKTGKAEGPVLRRLDVVTTPGGAADLFQSLRALPGINAPSEGAAVYVRGGPPDETLVRLDGGVIGHPYHYEGASGGLFSSLDTYMLKSAFFSSGGFSARYGGALSGVLDIETQDPMNLKTVSVGANLAGASVSSSWALIPDRLSFVGVTSHSYPGLLFRLYGSSREYESDPTSGNSAAKLLWRYSPTGRLAVDYLDARDAVTVIANALNYKGAYAENTASQTGALQFQDVLAGTIAVRGMASGQFYRSDWSFGPSSVDHTERNRQANLDAVWPLGSRHELAFGANLRHLDTEILGQAPADSTDLAPGAPARPLDTRAAVDVPGVYLEDKLRVWGPLYATLGGRADYASVPGVWTADPRGALAWRVDEHQTVRVAAGRYHQLASPQYLDPVYGNPRLEPLEADHVIAGYEWKSEFGDVRLEGYRKLYRRLVTNRSDTWYGNGGSGYAQGVDFFLQGTWRWLSGWLSYGYLDSKRQQLDDPYPVPSPYGVAHTLTLVGRYDLSGRWQLGARYGYTSGRPYTPVTGRSWDAVRQVWHPIFGEHGSARIPEYHRLDLRLTRLFSLPRALGLPASGVCAFYVEGINVLGIANVLDYVYNSDYSQRYERLSYFSRRLAVAGFALSW